MATAGSIVVDLLMRTGSFETDTKRAEARLKSMEKTVDQWSKRVAFGATAASAAFVAWTMSMTKSMDATLKMAQQIGTTTEALTGLRYAAQQFANVSDQTFDMSLRRMARRISEAASGSGAAKDAIKALGLSAQELSSLSVDEQFLRVADAMKGTADQGTRLRATMAIFDTEGMPLVTALSQGRGELERYTEEAQRLGIVVSTDAAMAADRFQTSLNKMSASLQGLSISIGNQVLPVMSEFVDEAFNAANETDGILDSARSLAADQSLPEWIDVAGSGFAHLADVAVGLSKTVLVVAKAFRAVAADAEVVVKGMAKVQMWNWFDEGATQDFQQALESRNQIVSNFNEALVDLGTYQGDRYAQAWNRSMEKINFDRNFVGPMPPETLTPIEVRAPGFGSGKKGLDEGQRYIQQLQERVALLGLETEHEQLLARIKIGSLKFVTPAMKEQALALAKQLDDTQKQIELEEILRDLREQQSITQLQFMRELESFGQGDRVRQLNADLAKVEDRYRSIIDARRSSPLGLSDDELAQIRASLQIELDMVREFHEQKLALQKDWTLGASDALANYADEAANVYDSVGNLTSKAFKGMEDSLTEFVRTGKLSFSDLADSIIRDMIRIAIQQSVTGPLAGAAWNFLANVFNPISVGAGFSLGGSLGGSFTPTGPLLPLSSGGYTGDGGKYEPAGIVHKGEGVLNQDEIRALGGESGFNALRRALRTGHANGGMAGRPSLPPAVATATPEVHVVINNNGQQMAMTQQPKVTMDAVRGMVVEVFVSDTRVNGPITRSMRGAIGV